jgi:hypothetical protein
MTKFFKIIILCFSLILPSLNVVAAESSECGITTEESGLVVEKESMKICEGDISFTVLYLLFHKIFDQDDIKDIFEEIAPISTNVKKFAAAAGIGDTIVAIFEALTSIIISIATLLIAYSVIKVLYKTQTSGEFMGDGRAKVFPVIFNSLIVIFLITPVGSIVMVQLLVLIMAVIAIMLGNYFWSTFLNATSVKTSEATLNESAVIQQATSFSSGIIQTNACMERTNQAILNQKFKENSAYDKPNFGFNVDVNIGWDGISLGTDHDNIQRSTKKVHECLRYYIKPYKNGDNLMSGYSFNRPELLTCSGISLEKIEGILKYTATGVIYNELAESGLVDQINKTTEYVYEPAFFGSSHTCGNITYNVPKLQNMFADNEEKAEIQIQNVAGKFNVEIEYNKFKAENYSKINALLNADITKAKSNDLYKSYEGMINTLKEKVKKLIVVEEEFNKKEKGKLIYVKAITVLNELFGADYSNIGVFDNTGNDTLKAINIEVKKDGSFEEIEKRKYNFEFLNGIGAVIYDNLEQAHCAKNWDKLSDSRMTVKALNNGLEENLFFDEVSSKVNGSFNFECVRLTNKKGELKYDYNIKVDGFNQYEDINVNGSNIEQADITNGRRIDLLNILKNNIYPEKIKAAFRDKYILEGYIYYTKIAVSRALTESLKDLQDDQLLIKMRKDGWATSGAMMLQITMEQGNASVFKEGMSGTGNAIASITEGGTTFANEIAIQSEDEIDNANEVNDSVKLSPMILTEFLVQQSKVQSFDSKQAIDQMVDNSEKGMFQGFLGNIENMIFYPISYIKQASGIDQDQTLQDGLEECRNTDKVCVSKDTHPLNALMMFGQESMIVALNILLLDVIVQALNYLSEKILFGEDEKAGTKEKPGFMKNMLSGLKTIFKGVVGFLGSGVILIIKGVAILLDFMRPFVLMLFAAGVFLGYAVPTIPYVAFAVVFMGWIISIFQTMIALPIFVLFSASSTGQNSLSIMRIWQMTGGILLKPALLTIAIIFGWTLSSISLYYVNATVYSIFSATRPDNMIIGLIHTMLVYVMYVSLIYIVVHHSFKVINKLPDEILSLIDVKGSGDSQFIESLNFERFMQAKLATDAVDKTSGAARNKFKNSTDKLKAKNQQYQNIRDRHEAQQRDRDKN